TTTNSSAPNVTHSGFFSGSAPLRRTRTFQATQQAPVASVTRQRISLMEKPIWGMPVLPIAVDATARIIVAPRGLPRRTGMDGMRLHRRRMRCKVPSPMRSHGGPHGQPPKFEDPAMTQPPIRTPRFVQAHLPTPAQAADERAAAQAALLAAPAS